MQALLGVVLPAQVSVNHQIHQPCSGQMPPATRAPILLGNRGPVLGAMSDLWHLAAGDEGEVGPWPPTPSSRAAPPATRGQGPSHGRTPQVENRSLGRGGGKPAPPHVPWGHFALLYSFISCS